MNLSKNTTKVVILDTGCANLSSVKYAIERLGYAPVVTADPDLVINSDKLFLPGVGTASAAMAQLENRNLIQLIKRCKQPILGICLGMQLLASHSEEGNVDTLGLIDESIVKISNHGLPLPHMGWNNVNFDKTNPLFKNIPDNSYFYFVHSFALPICDFTIAQAHYGEAFTAAVQKNNYFGVQFHPERSGSVGATLLKNFLEM